MYKWQQEIVSSKKAEKLKVVPTLYIVDEPAKYGNLKRTFHECTQEYKIWEAAPFANDFIYTFLASPHTQEMGETVGVWTIKVYRLHIHSEYPRGSSSFECDGHGDADGLTITRANDKAITAEEFAEKLKTHKYRICQEDGGQLVPLVMYIE